MWAVHDIVKIYNYKRRYDEKKALRRTFNPNTSRTKAILTLGAPKIAKKDLHMTGSLNWNVSKSTFGAQVPERSCA